MRDVCRARLRHILRWGLSVQVLGRIQAKVKVYGYDSEEPISGRRGPQAGFGVNPFKNTGGQLSV